MGLDGGGAGLWGLIPACSACGDGKGSDPGVHAQCGLWSQPRPHGAQSRGEGPILVHEVKGLNTTGLKYWCSTFQSGRAGVAPWTTTPIQYGSWKGKERREVAASVRGLWRGRELTSRKQCLP